MPILFGCDRQTANLKATSSFCQSKFLVCENVLGNQRECDCRDRLLSAICVQKNVKLGIHYSSLESSCFGRQTFSLS